MRANIWLRYALGQSQAIQEVASNRSALWIGAALVLLTSVARNYDQTFIGERPARWIFGNLLFSFFSGSWLYLMVYAVFARWRMNAPSGTKPRFWSGWRSFMGLFWMNAPIAWLYAIPVERFLAAVPAAWANVTLLAIVSLWRVALMIRVIQSLCGVRIWLAACWVLFAAAFEVMVVFFFGEAFAQAIVRGMGGTRNSPAEEVAYGAAASAFVVAFWLAPISLLLGLIRPKHPARALPEVTRQPLTSRALVWAGLLWIAIALLPQVQLRRNLTVETLLAKGRPREALDFLSRHQPGHFAPARPLPPKPHEYSVFTELPECLAVVEPADAPWVRGLLINRLEETMGHYRWERFPSILPNDVESEIESMSQAISSFGPAAGPLNEMLAGLERIPEGQSWLGTNQIFLRAIDRALRENSLRNSRANPPSVPDTTSMLALSNRLARLLSPEFHEFRTYAPGPTPNP